MASSNIASKVFKMAHSATRTNFVGATVKEARKWAKQGVRTYAQAFAKMLKWAWKKVKQQQQEEVSANNTAADWSKETYRTMTDAAIDGYIWMTQSGKAWGFNVRANSGRSARVYFPCSMQDKEAGLRMLHAKINEAIKG